MDHAKLALTMPDGHVEIMTFVVLGRSPTLPVGAVWLSPGQWAREPSDANIVQELAKTYAHQPASPVRYRRIADDATPTDRTYRDAWVDDGKSISHDMPKAREIHVARLRKERAPLLDELDRLWSRANGQNNAKEAARIEVQRQALRDLPSVEHAKTIEELKAVKLPNG